MLTRRHCANAAKEAEECKGKDKHTRIGHMNVNEFIII